MPMNRRRLLASSAMLAGISIATTAPARAAQTVTSGGIGLRLADIQSIYEEGPVGQSFRNFIEPVSGASLYIDFGVDDLAQTIYVDGDITDDAVESLIVQLVPSDVEDQRAFLYLTAAGSIAEARAVTMVSPWVASVGSERDGILATWQLEPVPAGGQKVVNLIIALQQAQGT